MTIQLTQAILQREPFATDIASSMGKSALNELATLIQHSDASVRMDTIKALGGLDIGISYDLVFKAIDDTDINVVQAVIALIERQKSSISTPILLGLLDKVGQVDAKNSVILMLGERLAPNEAYPLEKYCSIQYGESVALHCVVALAKIGVDQRRTQFGAYLLSVKNDTSLMPLLFTFIDYIHQPWLLPSLRQLLRNTSVLQRFSANLPGIPSHIRMCDKALLCIAALVPNKLSFNTGRIANFSHEQLDEAQVLANHFRH